MSLDLPFKEEYNDPNSPDYQELAANLTGKLWIIYQDVDGFVGIRIISLTEGSVVCNYIVILAKN